MASNVNKTQGDSYFYGTIETNGTKVNPVTKTGDYTATTADDLIVCNSTTAFTILLPGATGTGQKLYIKNINTGVITVDGASSDTIDGVTTQTLAQWDGIQIIDYGTNTWIVI